LFSAPLIPNQPIHVRGGIDFSPSATATATTPGLEEVARAAARDGNRGGGGTCVGNVKGDVAIKGTAGGARKPTDRSSANSPTHFQTPKEFNVKYDKVDNAT